MTNIILKSAGRDETWGKLVKVTDKIISDHLNVKGLVQTTSYEFAAYFCELSLNGQRLITHTNANERDQCIKNFKESPLPLVMVSPSLTRGFDGKDDLCRFIVVTKIPYPNPQDPQISRRLREPGGQIWYTHNVIRTIIQETSRGNRHKHDYCETYILDMEFGKIFSAYKGIFPKWWKAALNFENDK